MANYPMTLYYDGACPLCNAEIGYLRRHDTDGLLRFIDIAAPGFDASEAGADLADLMALIHARCADGRLIRGVEVFRLAYAAIGLHAIAHSLDIRWVRWAAERAYPWIARHRHRLPAWAARGVIGLAARRQARRAARQVCTADRCTR